MRRNKAIEAADDVVVDAVGVADVVVDVVGGVEVLAEDVAVSTQ